MLDIPKLTELAEQVRAYNQDGVLDITGLGYAGEIRIQLTDVLFFENFKDYVVQEIRPQKYFSKSTGLDEIEYRVITAKSYGAENNVKFVALTGKLPQDNEN